MPWHALLLLVELHLGGRSVFQRGIDELSDLDERLEQVRDGADRLSDEVVS
jgi:hypothetical protein